MKWRCQEQRHCMIQVARAHDPPCLTDVRHGRAGLVDQLDVTVERLELVLAGARGSSTARATLSASPQCPTTAAAACRSTASAARGHLAGEMDRPSSLG